jgi:hypothetical protein
MSFKSKVAAATATLTLVGGVGMAGALTPALIAGTTGSGRRAWPPSARTNHRAGFIKSQMLADAAALILPSALSAGVLTVVAAVTAAGGGRSGSLSPTNSLSPTSEYRTGLPPRPTPRRVRAGTAHRMVRLG